MLLAAAAGQVPTEVTVAAAVAAGSQAAVVVQELERKLVEAAAEAGSSVAPSLH